MVIKVLEWLPLFMSDYLDKLDNVNHSVDAFEIPNKSDVKEQWIIWL